MSDDKNTIVKQASQQPQAQQSVAGQQQQSTQLPIDLPGKVLVKQADGKGQTTTHQTFRAINPPVRVVTMPGSSQSAQIIQTLVPSMLKPATIQGRPITNSTITMSKAPYHLPRGTATLTSIQATKNAISPIRTPTPPASGSTAPSLQQFVRTTMTPRTSSPTTTVSVLSSSGNTWVQGASPVQMQIPAQIIRSSNLTQNRSNTGITNIYGTPVSQQNLGNNQAISVSTTTTATGQQQYVATVVNRNQAIVYTNPSSQPTQFVGGQQRLSVMTSQRQVRPVQRVPTQNIRVAPVNIRAPMLTQNSVLTTIPQTGQVRSTTVQSSSAAMSNAVPTRIIQVQSQSTANSTGTTGSSITNPQVIRHTHPKLSNMMLPILVNNTRKSSLAIAHVSKIPASSTTVSSTAVSASASTPSPANEGGTLTTTIPSIPTSMVASAMRDLNTSTNAFQSSFTTQPTSFQQQSQQQSQINQIVVSQQQLQHQQSPNIATAVLPLTITSRVNTIPIKTISVSAANQSLENRSISSNNSNTATTILPIAKIISQQQQSSAADSQQQSNVGTISSASNVPLPQPVYIHTRIPSTVTTTNNSSTSSIPASVYYEHLSTTASSTPVVPATTTTATDKTTTRLISGMPQTIICTNQSSLQQHQQQTSQSSQSQHQPQQNQPAHQIIGMTSSQSSGNAPNESPTHMIIQRVGGINKSEPISMVTTHLGSHQIKLNKKFTCTTRPGAATVSRNILVPSGRAHSPLSQPQQQSQIIQQPQSQIPQMESSVNTHENVMRLFSPTQQQRRDSRESDGSTTISAPNSPPFMDDLDDDDDSFLDRFKNDPSSMAINETAKLFKYNVQPHHLDDHKKPGNYIMQYPTSTSGGTINTGPSTSKHSENYRGEKHEEPRKRKKQVRAPDIMPEAGPSHCDTAESNENGEYIIKIPFRRTLLEANHSNWKSTHNHFQRWSDVRPRDERKQSASDLANLPNIKDRIKGWKLHHLFANVDDLIDTEQTNYNKMSELLTTLDEFEKCPDNERTKELVKGNMQRIKLVIDNLNDVKSNLSKGFDNEAAALEIVEKLQARRNKKRDKN